MAKKSKERGLGRGLSALMSDVSVAAIPKEAEPVKKATTEKTVKSVAKPASQIGGVTRLAPLASRAKGKARRYAGPYT